MRYLVVEDDKEMASLIKRGLETTEIKVIVVHDGETALTKLRLEAFDIAILDVMIPKVSGLEIARRIRSEGIDTPILFLTAKDSLSDRVTGLEVGGDDYLVKPFEFIELNARIKALTRRTSVKAKDSFRYGDIHMDLLTQRVSRGDKAINLSPREFALLALLIKYQDVVFSRKQILDEIWEGSDFVDPNIVDQYVSYVRKKIDVGETSVIETIRGVGYRTPKLQP
jgi:two-component system OmpR family response regulator